MTAQEYVSHVHKHSRRELNAITSEPSTPQRYQYSHRANEIDSSTGIVKRPREKRANHALTTPVVVKEGG